MEYQQKNSKDYIVLTCSKEGLRCEFILMEEFISGVVVSSNYHFHSAYEVHIPIEGRMHIIAEDSDVFLYPGQVCIIPPDVIHYVCADDSAFRIGFRFTYSHVGYEINPGSALFEKAYRGMNDVYVVNNCPIYQKYLSVAAQNLKDGMPGFMAAELLFLALYEIAAGICPQRRIGAASETSDFLLSEKIEEFLNDSYNRTININDLSEYLCLSKRQTQRVLNRLFGATFSSLINRKRLAVAKHFLKNSDLSIDEIVQKVGYRDPSYFYRKFSEAFSVTPGKYREQY